MVGIAHRNRNHVRTGRGPAPVHVGFAGEHEHQEHAVPQPGCLRYGVSAVGAPGIEARVVQIVGHRFPYYREVLMQHRSRHCELRVNVGVPGEYRHCCLLEKSRQLPGVRGRGNDHEVGFSGHGTHFAVRGNLNVEAQRFKIFGNCRIIGLARIAARTGHQQHVPVLQGRKFRQFGTGGPAPKRRSCCENQKPGDSREAAGSVTNHLRSRTEIPEPLARKTRPPPCSACSPCASTGPR